MNHSGEDGTVRLKPTVVAVREGAEGDAEGERVVGLGGVGRHPAGGDRVDVGRVAPQRHAVGEDRPGARAGRAGEIGEAEHDRYIVDLDKYMAKLKAKIEGAPKA